MALHHCWHPLTSICFDYTISRKPNSQERQLANSSYFTSERVQRFQNRNLVRFFQQLQYEVKVNVNQTPMQPGSAGMAGNPDSATVHGTVAPGSWDQPGGPRKPGTVISPKRGSARGHLHRQAPRNRNVEPNRYKCMLERDVLRGYFDILFNLKLFIDQCKNDRP